MLGPALGRALLSACQWSRPRPSQPLQHHGGRRQPQAHHLQRLFRGCSRHSGSTRTVCDAPETENGPIVPASDIWSLGATLVEVLTKYPPQWNRSKTAEPTVPESMPEPFASIARKCLCSDPARRITLAEIAARLDPAKASSRPQEKPATASPHRRRIAIPLAFAALVLAGVGIWFAVSHREPRPLAAQQAQNFPAAAPVKAVPALAPGAHSDALSDRYPERNRDHNTRRKPRRRTSTAVTPPASNPAPVACSRSGVAASTTARPPAPRPRTISLPHPQPSTRPS